MKFLILLSVCVAGVFAVGSKVDMTPEEMESLDFQSAVRKASRDFNLNSNERPTNVHVVVKTSAATKQLVAGLLYEFNAHLSETVCENNMQNLIKDESECPLSGKASTVCRYGVLFQAWKHPSYSVVSKVGCGQALGLEGGKEPLSEEEMQSPMFQKALQQAFTSFNSQSNMARQFTMIKTEYPFKQVVAGLIYEFDGIFSETVCDNTYFNREKTFAQCSVAPNGQQFRCHYKFWLQPWLIHGVPSNDMVQLNEHQCSEVQQDSFSLAGGKSPLTPQDVQSPSFLIAMQLANKQFNIQSNSVSHHAIFQFHDGTKQVVSGMLYEFQATMAKTTCRNTIDNQQKGLEECPMQDMASTCTFRVHYVAWAPETSSATIVKCA